MIIISENKNESGAYPPLLNCQYTTPPEGYLEVSGDTKIFYEYNGFVNLLVEFDTNIERNIVTSFEPNLANWNLWKSNLIMSIKSEKLSELSESCKKTILAGVDVETTKGIEHFSLEETDQINLTAAINAIQQGATDYPYHADGQLCRMFSSEEIIAISNAAVHHKLYHTTLCNHLMTWVRRTESVEELNNIIYSIDNMPEDLLTNMNSILSTN